MDMKLKVAEYIAAAAQCCFENCGLGCDILTSKMTDTILNVKFGSVGAKIASHRDTFEKLDVWKQIRRRYPLFMTVIILQKG